MECVPTVSAEVETCAVPRDKAAVPRDVVPSLNVTVPDGVPPAGLLVTVAEKVTEFPNADGLRDDVTPVVVGWFVTVWTTESDDCPYEVLPP